LKFPQYPRFRASTSAQFFLNIYVSAHQHLIFALPLSTQRRCSSLSNTFGHRYPTSLDTSTQTLWILLPNAFGYRYPRTLEIFGAMTRWHLNPLRIESFEPEYGRASNFRFSRGLGFADC